ncbi:hypothetical protein JCM11491_006337 [Sporobolomyces phaffii]
MTPTNPSSASVEPTTIARPPQAAKQMSLLPGFAPSHPSHPHASNALAQTNTVARRTDVEEEAMRLRGGGCLTGFMR